MKRTQRGITLIGFIVVLGVVGLFAYVGMKLFPMYMEYYGVKQAMRELASEPGVATYEPAKIRDLFFRRLYINYSDDNITNENVDVKRVDNGWHMTVKYEVRKSMIGNLDVVGKFNASQQLSRKDGIE
ncbi:DUF4845 domain-containing protein [Luteimonas vadosa]|uniref:DUF4845 domain-containing protein n=1 Tax=Luteimonas vadosa TaxID=1165507 RepID=A0ABP9DXQ3_9GAMM